MVAMPLPVLSGLEALRRLEAITHPLVGRRTAELMAQAAPDQVVVYDVLGPPGTTARISYFDDVANLHNVEHAPLPWSATVTTTLPTVSANIMVQADGAGVTCRITVDDVVKDERTSDGVNPQTYCLVKSA